MPYFSRVVTASTLSDLGPRDSMLYDVFSLGTYLVSFWCSKKENWLFVHTFLHISAIYCLVMSFWLCRWRLTFVLIVLHVIDSYMRNNIAIFSHWARLLQTAWFISSIFNLFWKILEFSSLWFMWSKFVIAKYLLFKFSLILILWEHGYK